ncbi:MAG: sugar phosphate isomerase/epimerase family protein [Planctomycetaceae bacterium]
MPYGFDRRSFLASSAALFGGAVASRVSAQDTRRKQPLPDTTLVGNATSPDQPLYKISLAEWSLHRMLQKGELDNLDFSKYAKNECGIEAVEYVNQFFMDKAKDKAYLGELKTRAADLDVENVLIMIDREGALGDPDEAKRTQAVENHYKWVEAAEFLGCHSIRVNAQSSGGYVETIPLAADGLRRLCEFADQHAINVIVENHGGLSSNGAWLASVMEVCDHPRVGTLPDFGNFFIDREKGIEYDRYKGVMQLMPYAKAVSAKSHDFGPDGRETHTDYERMMGIVTGWGYHGYVGIEYEGSELGEKEGILATRKLLESVRERLSQHS